MDLGIDWIATAALAACVGLAGPKSLKPALGLCVVVGLLGWAASYLIMAIAPRFGGDTNLSEDWFNGFSLGNASVEIAVALVWTFLWFGIGRVARFGIGRGRKRAT